LQELKAALVAAAPQDSGRWSVTKALLEPNHRGLTDGREVVSHTRRPAALYPQEGSWYSFLLETESTPGS
jgi:hypothetical protein